MLSKDVPVLTTTDWEGQRAEVAGLPRRVRVKFRVRFRVRLRVRFRVRSWFNSPLQSSSDHHWKTHSGQTLA